MNGTERFKLDTAYVENDSLHIPMSLYDSELVGKIGEGRLTGVWRVRRADNVSGELPFEAVLGEDYRFFKTSDGTSFCFVWGYLVGTVHHGRSCRFVSKQWGFLSRKAPD